MKYEWRKKDKDIYLPKQVPTITTLKAMQYLTVEGGGIPGQGEFTTCLEALYPLSYGIKMAPKKGIEIPGYFDYTVFPLEGFWSFNERGIELYKQGFPVLELKEHLIFKLMIRQPDFVSNEFLESVKETVFKKNNNSKVPTVKLETIDEGLVCQMLHIGSYDSEPASFEKMELYCKENGFERVSKDHKEIYISDARRVAAEKLKTTLRFKVKKID